MEVSNLEAGTGVYASLVTGGASGIGRSVCHRLAAHGPIAILDKNLEGATATATSITTHGGTALVFECDVTSPLDLDQAVARFVAHTGRLDIAVASAGIDHTGTVLSEPVEAWDRVLDVNAKGVYLTARATFPRFVDRHSGSFVAIASDAGIVGARDFGVYCASKHAVVGMVRALALDFAEMGVRSNVVCPAFVRTPMSEAYLAKAGPDEEKYYRRVVPLGRFAEPLEVAHAVEFLALPTSSYVNGTIYCIDGGATVDLIH